MTDPTHKPATPAGRPPASAVRPAPGEIDAQQRRMTMDDKLLKAAVNAAEAIGAIYKWLDMVDAAGGATSIEGVAKCHAMLKSLRSQRSRLDRLIIVPLNEAINERRGAK